MADTSRRYLFGPLERRGLLLGLRAGQLAVLAGAGLTACVALKSAGGRAGVAAAVVVLVAGGVMALWTRSDVTMAGWASLAMRWALRRAGGPRLSGEPLAGTIAVPAGTKRPTRVSRPTVGGIEVETVESAAGREGFGAVRDRRTGLLSAVTAVSGRPFALCDPDEQAACLDAWRSVLASLGRPGSPVRRVQWVLRSGPAGRGDFGAPAVAPAGEPGGGYADVAAGAEALMQVHEVWVVLAVPATGRARSVESLGRETRLLAGQLRAAGVASGPPLDVGAVQQLLAAGHTSTSRSSRPWPLATDEAWGCFRTDGAWHATFWIAEWPRVEVGPDFLTPLLFGDGRRTVSVIMQPVPADRAMRETRSARTADVADEELRTRAGFLPTARRGREAEDVVRREEELSVGHADYRFSGYLTVSAGDRASLESACAEAEQTAQAARVELRRLYGRQADAFTWTLPLARGLV